MINALDLKERLQMYSDKELKNMKVRIENTSLSNLTIEYEDSFKCNDVVVSNDNKTLILEF